MSVFIRGVKDFYSTRNIPKENILLKEQMSKSTSLSKVGVVEIVTGINSIGLLYIWYELQRVGADLTQKVKDITLVLKTVNANVNTVSQHFKAHLVHHKNVLDVDHTNSSDNDHSNDGENISKEMLLSRIRKLEDRLAILEYTSNPIHQNN